MPWELSIAQHGMAPVRLLWEGEGEWTGTSKGLCGGRVSPEVKVMPGDLAYALEGCEELRYRDQLCYMAGLYDFVLLPSFKVRSSGCWRLF